MTRTFPSTPSSGDNPTTATPSPIDVSNQYSDDRNPEPRRSIVILDLHTDPSLDASGGESDSTEPSPLKGRSQSRLPLKKPEATDAEAESCSETSILEASQNSRRLLDRFRASQEEPLTLEQRTSFNHTVDDVVDRYTFQGFKQVSTINSGSHQQLRNQAKQEGAADLAPHLPIRPPSVQLHSAAPDLPQSPQSLREGSIQTLLLVPFTNAGDGLILTGSKLRPSPVWTEPHQSSQMAKLSHKPSQSSKPKKTPGGPATRLANSQSAAKGLNSVPEPKSQGGLKRKSAKPRNPKSDSPQSADRDQSLRENSQFDLPEDETNDDRPKKKARRNLRRPVETKSKQKKGETVEQTSSPTKHVKKPVTKSTKKSSNPTESEQPTAASTRARRELTKSAQYEEKDTSDEEDLNEVSPIKLSGDEISVPVGPTSPGKSPARTSPSKTQKIKRRQHSQVIRVRRSVQDIWQNASSNAAGANEDQNELDGEDEEPETQGPSDPVQTTTTTPSKKTPPSMLVDATPSKSKEKPQHETHPSSYGLSQDIVEESYPAAKQPLQVREEVSLESLSSAEHDDNSVENESPAHQHETAAVTTPFGDAKKFLAAVNATKSSSPKARSKENFLSKSVINLIEEAESMCNSGNRSGESHTAESPETTIPHEVSAVAEAALTLHTGEEIIYSEEPAKPKHTRSEIDLVSSAHKKQTATHALTIPGVTSTIENISISKPASKQVSPKASVSSNNLPPQNTAGEGSAMAETLPTNKNNVLRPDMHAKRVTGTGAAGKGDESDEEYVPKSTSKLTISRVIPPTKQRKSQGSPRGVRSPLEVRPRPDIRTPGGHRAFPVTGTTTPRRESVEAGMPLTSERRSRKPGLVQFDLNGPMNQGVGYKTDDSVLRTATKISPHLQRKTESMNPGQTTQFRFQNDLSDPADSGSAKPGCLSGRRDTDGSLSNDATAEMEREDREPAENAIDTYEAVEADTCSCDAENDGIQDPDSESLIIVEPARESPRIDDAELTPSTSSSSVKEEQVSVFQADSDDSTGSEQCEGSITERISRSIAMDSVPAIPLLDDAVVEENNLREREDPKLHTQRGSIGLSDVSRKIHTDAADWINTAALRKVTLNSSKRRTGSTPKQDTTDLSCLPMASIETNGAKSEVYKPLSRPKIVQRVEQLRGSPTTAKPVSGLLKKQQRMYDPGPRDIGLEDPEIKPQTVIPRPKEPIRVRRSFTDDQQAADDRPTATPVPFHSKLSHAVETVRQKDAKPEDQNRGKSFLSEDTNDTTLIQHTSLSRPLPPHTPLVDRPTRQDSETTDESSSSISREASVGQGSRETRVTVPHRSSRELFDDLMQIAADVIFRLGVEEDAARAKVDEFQHGALGILQDLVTSWNDRILHENERSQQLLRDGRSEMERVLKNPKGEMGGRMGQQLDRIRSIVAVKSQRLSENISDLLVSN